MSGVIFNVLTVIAGTLIGLAAGRFIHDRFHEIIIWAVGLSTFAFGAVMVVQGISQMGDSDLGDYSLLVVVGSMVLGAVIGEALDIEKWLKKLGKAVNKAVRKIPLINNKETGKSSTFVDGFVTASILYCVGPMTILGSIQDGLGEHATLYLKSILDGTMAIIFSTTLGIGVGFSAIPIFVFQGALALGAQVFAPFFSDIVVSSITAVGGILILAIGLDMLKIKKIRVANMLPALFIVGILGGFLG